jgi:hypothetical protein
MKAVAHIRLEDADILFDSYTPRDIVEALAQIDEDDLVHVVYGLVHRVYGQDVIIVWRHSELGRDVTTSSTPPADIKDRIKALAERL